MIHKLAHRKPPEGITQIPKGLNQKLRDCLETWNCFRHANIYEASITLIPECDKKHSITCPCKILNFFVL